MFVRVSVSVSQSHVPHAPVTGVQVTSTWTVFVVTPLIPVQESEKSDVTTADWVAFPDVPLIPDH
jgi:hypothetical protein